MQYFNANEVLQHCEHEFCLVLVLFVMCEERKPTRCNNIDDLLSIVDVDY